MYKYLASAAALALVGGAASAQDTATSQANTGMSAQVKELQEARTEDQRGIGADVSAAARERNELRRAAREDDELDTDDDDTDVAVTGRANANTNSAALRAAAVAAGGSANSSVRDNTGAVAALRADRSGRDFATDARGSAASGREIAAHARATAVDGRAVTADVRAAAQTARENAAAVRDAARDIRSTVRDSRPGRGG